MVNSNAEQENLGKWCIELLCRDAEGSLSTAFADGEDKSKGFSDALIERCANLQGKMITPHLGMGTSNIIISKIDLKLLGFHLDSWKTAENEGLIQTTRYNDMPCYMINYDALVDEFHARLEAITGKSQIEAAALLMVSTKESHKQR